MKKVLFATGNEAKVKRLQKELLENGLEIITINDLKEKIDVEENGKNAIENALIKAKAYSKIIDIPVFAMDDNLYIEGIPEEKQPGMFVRRVNGKRLNDEEMIEYYSNLAHEYGKEGKLTTRWVYAIAVVNKENEATYTWSKDVFYLVDKPSKVINPGYPLNSVSIDKETNEYYSETTKTKNKKYDESDVIEFLVTNILK